MLYPYWKSGKWYQLGIMEPGNGDYSHERVVRLPVAALEVEVVLGARQEVIVAEWFKPGGNYNKVRQVYIPLQNSGSISGYFAQHSASVVQSTTGTSNFSTSMQSGSCRHMAIRAWVGCSTVMI